MLGYSMSLSIISHIKRLKEKNHVLRSTDGEKASACIHDKSLRENRPEGNIAQYNKGSSTWC